ncbi:MAG: Ig domain-containing protein [Ruthenibacterium sp.]
MLRPCQTALWVHTTSERGHGTAPAWSVSNGTLPAGLSLNASTGEISGTPTAQGANTFTVTATNAYGSDSRQLAITITIPATILSPA